MEEDYPRTRLVYDDTEPEIVVAQAPPQRDYSRGVPLGDNPATLVPGGATQKPPTETAKPRDYSKGVPLGDNPTYNPQPKYETGFGQNVVTGIIEGSTPGLAGAIASPVDIPLSIARELYGSVRRVPLTVGAIAREFTGNPYTDKEYLEARQKLDESNPIPDSPVTRYLTNAAHNYLGLPTPEHPSESVKAADRSEEKARRMGQVIGQVGTTILGSRMYKPITPYMSAPRVATQAIPGTGEKLLSALTIPPRFLSSAPPVSSALVAGGASYAGQSASDAALKAGYSPTTAHALEAGTELAGNVVGGVGAAGTSIAANAARNRYIPNVPHYTDEFVAGMPFGYASQAATDRLAARQLERSAASPLSDPRYPGPTGTQWDPTPPGPGSSDVVGNALNRQLTQAEARALAQQQAEQAAANQQFGGVGGTVSHLDTRISSAESALHPHVAGMQFNPEELGMRLRASAGSQRKNALIDEILDVDANTGKFTLAHSDVPGKIFNKNLSPEDMNNLMWRSKSDFRQAFRDSGMANFEEAAAARDASGAKTGGIDITKADKWLQDHAKLLDLYERQSNRLWGRADTSIRDQITSATSQQRMLNNLNAERDLMTGAYQTGGRSAQAAATAAGKQSGIWQPGAAGGQSTRDYLRSQNNSPEAVENLVHVASSSLRNAATRRTGAGELDPVAYRQWEQAHREALSQLPLPVRQQFENVASAQELVDARIARDNHYLNQFRTGAAAGYLNGQSPRQAIEAILSNTAQDPAVAMRELSNRLAHDPAAHDALKRDFMQVAVDTAKAAATSPNAPQSNLQRLLSFIPGHGTSPSSLRENSKQFMHNMNEFLDRNESTVRALYGDEATNNMKRLVAENAGLGKPGSTMGQVIGALAVVADYYGPGLMTRAGLSPKIQALIGGAMVANAAAKRIRLAGIRDANDLIPRAMTNPALMRALMADVHEPGAINRVIRQLTVTGVAEDMGDSGIMEGAKNQRSDTTTGDLSNTKRPMGRIPTIPGLAY